MEKITCFLEYDSKLKALAEKLNINVAIAAAITSYARIEINKYKHIPGITCLYSDTDSAITSAPLPTALVGPGLGQMKVVHQIEKGIFIAHVLVVT